MTSLEAQRAIQTGINCLKAKTKEKLDLIDAEETHGEELNDDALAADMQRLEEMDATLGQLDLSYIE